MNNKKQFLFLALAAVILVPTGVTHASFLALLEKLRQGKVVQSDNGTITQWITVMGMGKRVSWLNQDTAHIVCKVSEINKISDGKFGVGPGDVVVLSGTHEGVAQLAQSLDNQLRPTILPLDAYIPVEGGGNLPLEKDFMVLFARLRAGLTVVGVNNAVERMVLVGAVDRRLIDASQQQDATVVCSLEGVNVPLESVWKNEFVILNGTPDAVAQLGHAINENSSPSHFSYLTAHAARARGK